MKLIGRAAKVSGLTFEYYGKIDGKNVLIYVDKHGLLFEEVEESDMDKLKSLVKPQTVAATSSTKKHTDSNSLDIFTKDEHE